MWSSGRNLQDAMVLVRGLESSENRLDLARGVKILHSLELHGRRKPHWFLDTVSRTPGAKDFLPKKKKFQPKPKKSKKKPCSESQQNTGKGKGGERSKTTITERNDDFEMAMAMSVTEEIERVRQAENDRELKYIIAWGQSWVCEQWRWHGGDQPNANW